MHFKVANITGIDDAIISLMMCKRKYSPEAADNIRNLVAHFSGNNGSITLDDSEDATNLKEYLDKICKFGLQMGYKKNHETILRYIDFTIETQGLHKAGMGNLDAHAMRMNNRIVRASSRMAKFEDSEKSSFYQGKILSVGEAAKLAGCEDRLSRDTISEFNGADYRFNGYGWVRTDCWNNQDVQRGTYFLSIPSDSIWKCNLIDLRHIYALRNETTHAHPELAQGLEQVAEQAEKMLPVLGKSIAHEWIDGEWVHISKVKLAVE